MKRLVSLLATLALAAAIALSFSAPALAHNRAHVILPSGVCIIVGSEKSVVLPDGTLQSNSPANMSCLPK